MIGAAHGIHSFLDDPSCSRPLSSFLITSRIAHGGGSVHNELPVQVKNHNLESAHSLCPQLMARDHYC